MAKSKNRPKYKAKKKKANIHKQNLKQMANKAKNEPITFVYNKDKETVEVPIKMWQTLNQAAQQLQGIAVFVSTMETVGQLHMQDGTLLPVFQDDLEVGTQKNPDGSPQMKIKDSFWIRGNDKGAPVTVPPTTEEVITLQAEGKFQEETPTVEVVSSAQ